MFPLQPCVEVDREIMHRIPVDAWTRDPKTMLGKEYGIVSAMLDKECMQAKDIQKSIGKPRAWPFLGNTVLFIVTWHYAMSLMSFDASNPKAVHVKVSDFGMSVEGTYTYDGATMPTRWVPPEVLRKMKWSNTLIC